MPDPTGTPPDSKPEKDIFELAPMEAAPPGPPTDPAKATSPKPAIAAPGLTEGFDEDADFERDPEVERALGRGGLTPVVATEVSLEPDFIKPGLGDAKLIAWIGAGVLLSAIVAAGFSAATRGWAHSLMVAYTTLLHTGTGVGALAIAAKLSERRLGQWELGAARMLVAVGLLELVFHLRLPYGVWLNTIAAVGTYTAATMFLFRLPIQEWFITAASHFGIWTVVSGAVWLHDLLGVAPSKVTGS